MGTVKEITVFNPRAPVRMQTKTERNILFEELSVGMDVPRYHFEAFNESSESIIDNARINSDIPALILKNIRDHIGPITPKDNYRDFTVSVQLNSPIRTFDKYLEAKKIAASNSQINMVGILFNSTHNYSNSTRLVTHIQRSSLDEKIMSGIFDNFFQRLTYLKLQEKSILVFFKNTKNAIRSLKLLDMYVEFRKSYYADSLPYMHFALGHVPYAHINAKKHAKHASGKKKKRDDLTWERHTPLIKLLSGVYPNNVCADRRMVLLYDLMYGNIWNIYQNAKIHGLDSQIVNSMVEEEHRRQGKKKRDHMAGIDIIEKKMVKGAKLSLARSLFHKSSVGELTTKELDVVNLTYEKEQMYSLVVKDNKCPHVSLLGRTMKSNNSGGYFNRRTWEELKLLIPNTGNSTGLLQCTVCNLFVLCPHHYDRFEYRLTEDGADGESDKRLRIMLLRKYADKSPIKNAYFCKICGERIVQKYNEQHASYIHGDYVHVEHARDVMSNTVWKSVRGVLGSHVQFNITADINNLASTIAENIQPFIEDENDRWVLVRTNTPDAIKNIMYLYINIYTYAALIRIMSHHPDDITFKSDKKKKTPSARGGASQVRGSVNMKYLQQLFVHGLRILINTKSVLIEKIPKMTPAAVKSLLIKAYRDVSTLFIKTEEYNNSLPPEHVAYSIAYRYLYYVKKKGNPGLDFSNIDAILGVSLADVEKMTTHLTANATIPAIWGVVLPEKSHIASHNREALSIYNKYAYASFLHFIKYVKHTVYMCPGFNNESRSQHRAEYEKLKKIEMSMKKKMRAYLKHAEHIYHNVQYGDYTYTPVDLSMIFCPDGRRHKFDIHIFTDGTLRVEIGKSDMNDWMVDPKKNMRLGKLKRVDRKCSNCGTLMSKSAGSGKSVLDTLNKNDDVDAFFIMYTFMCPVSGTHDWSSGQKQQCKKCNGTKEMMSRKDSSYYEKYKRAFHTHIDRRKEEDASDRRTSSDGSVGDTGRRVKYAAWKKSTVNIEKLAKFTNYSVYSISNLGLAEGRVFDQMAVGPSSPIDGDCMGRIGHLSSYMRIFNIEYEMLRNGNINHPKLDMYAKQWDNVDFSQFPDVYGDYNEKYRYYVSTMMTDVDGLANFIIESLASSLMSINTHYGSSTGQKNQRDASRQYILYTIKKILRIEKQISDPGIFRGKRAEYEDVDGDDGEYEGDVSGVDLHDYDPFSLSTSDIDSSNITDNITTGGD